MSDKNAGSFDPFAIWRAWVVKSEEQWSESLTQLLKNDMVATAAGYQMQQARYLQRMFADAMQPVLAGFNLPSRSDLDSLEERLGKVEDGLAALEAAIVQLRRALVDARGVPAEQAGASPRPPRTRKAKPAARSAAAAAAAGGTKTAPLTSNGGSPAVGSAAGRETERPTPLSPAASDRLPPSSALAGDAAASAAPPRARRMGNRGAKR
jgi:hypothetical protein